MGRSLTVISSLTTELVVSPVHWYFIDSHVGSKDEILALIEENFMRRTDVSSPNFEILQFLFACLCFHYKHLDAHIHKNHCLRGSPIFIAVGEAKNLQIFDFTRYPCTITTYNPYAAVIPPHAMLMSEIEPLKDNFEQKTRNIVQEMRNELNDRNAGGDLYKAGCIIDKIRAAN